MYINKYIYIANFHLDDLTVAALAALAPPIIAMLQISGVSLAFAPRRKCKVFLIILAYYINLWALAY